MRTRRLGETSLELTELGFGGSAIGGLSRAVSREDAFEALQAAWDAGIRYFDTAPFYGFGLSERRTGDFLRDKPEGAYVLSTKVGRLLTPAARADIPKHGFADPPPFEVSYDYGYDGIMRSAESSLARLGLNRIDILYVHDLEPSTHGAEGYQRHFRTFMNGGLRALKELKSSGTIKAFGIGVNDADVCHDVLGFGSFDCVLLTGRHTLLDRSVSPALLDLCRRRGTSLVIGGVFQSAGLAGGEVPGAFFDDAPADTDMAEQVAEDDGTPLAALRFPLNEPLITSVLVGTAKASSLMRNVELLDAFKLQRARKQVGAVALSQDR